MDKMGPNFDYISEFSDNWNKRISPLRKAGIIISVLMLILGVLLLIFPMQSAVVIEVIAALLIVVLGISQIVEYVRMPPYIRRAGILVLSILNIIFGILLAASPNKVGVPTFAFMFGLMMLMAGIDKLTLADRLKFFSVPNCVWVIASGVFSIIAAVFFIVAPFASTIVLSCFIAVYLLVGGLTLLVESLSMKDM
jgi:uncharacterized membrane protein HdeD (DUF308 family)